MIVKSIGIGPLPADCIIVEGIVCTHGHMGHEKKFNMFSEEFPQ